MVRGRRVVVVSLALCAGAIAAGSASAEQPPGPSCNGVLVSSLAGTGLVDDATRQFHQDFKDLGIPPGQFDAAGAHEHGASVPDCLPG